MKRPIDRAADHRLVVKGADRIHQAFQALQLTFDEVTSRARRLFEHRGWAGGVLIDRSTQQNE